MEQDVLTRNNVQVLGDTGQPIMFAHGFGCEQRIWRLVAPAFAGAYRLVLFDYIGSGKSDRHAFSVDRYSTLAGSGPRRLSIAARRSFLRSELMRLPNETHTAQCTDNR